MVAIFSVAVLPTGLMESLSYSNWRRRAAQFHPVVIVVSPFNAFDQIDAKKKNVSRKTYSVLKIKLRQTLKKSWTKINSSNQIAGSGVTCGVTI